MRRLLLIPAAALTALLLAYGCYLIVDLLALEHRSETRELAGVEAVHLDLEGGGVVRVVGDRPAGAEVAFRWKEGLQHASFSARVDAGRLVVRSRCPQVFNTFCTVSATIHVPRGTPVTGTSDATVEVVDVGGRVDLAVDDGGIRVEKAEGPVHARTDNGGITIVGGHGDLDLSSDNGSIRTDGASPDRVSAETDNGGITLDVASTPTRVEAASDNGGITVLLPPDAPDYATQTSTDNGGIENLLRTNPRAERVVVATTDNGGISLRYRG